MVLINISIYVAIKTDKKFLMPLVMLLYKLQGLGAYRTHLPVFSAYLHT